MADSYDEQPVEKIKKEFWKLSHSAKLFILGSNLYKGLDYL